MNPERANTQTENMTDVKDMVKELVGQFAELERGGRETTEMPKFLIKVWQG